VTGRLSTTAPGVTVGEPTSAYPDLTFGLPAGNTTPFQATLASTTECGVSVPFTLMLSTNQGTQAVSFNVVTGSAGTPVVYNGTGVPSTIASPGFTTSTFTVATAGRVHGMSVTLSNISQSYDGDLRIDLIAPDGTDVELYAPNPAKGGQNFTNTVFDDAATSSIMAASPPYTGTYKPAQPLAALDGVQQQGTWQLVISNSRFGDTGTLSSWGASVAPAVCAPPAPIDPDGDAEGHGDGDGHGRGHAKHSTSHHRGAE
jgi:subtilisin-like proprotein convertase family protein